MMTFLLVGILYFLLFLSLYAATNHLLHKLRRLPPSPFPTLPILGHMHLLKKPLHHSFTSLSSSLGPVLLIQFGSRRVLVISSPSAAEECLSENDIIFANRPRLLAGKHLGYDYTSLLWAPYGEYWRNLRRVASLELLSPRRIQMLSYIRSDEVRLLVKWLAARMDGGCGGMVNMKTALFDVVLNVGMRILVGKRYCGEGSDSEEAREFHGILQEMFRMSGAGNVDDFLPIVKWFGVKGVEESMIKLQQRKHVFLQRLIDEKKRATIDADEKMQ